ncbi:MAG: thiamine pyrophosphokinase [Firmicutes bacterium]|nr:thiamine pyrophosphokinase [Bacillota bacterium]
MSNRLALPQVEFFFSEKIPTDQLLFVAGGRPPAEEWLAQAAKLFPVWGIDRGVDSCRSASVKPVQVIGDGDSASTDGWRWVKTLGIPVEIHPPEKDLTDLQLSLKRAGQQYNQATVIVTGVWGGRFDHLFSNIYSLLGGEAFGLTTCCAADDKEVLVLLRGPKSLNIHPKLRPTIVSLLPLSPCTGVSIDGVRWPLSGVDLTMELPYAISNRPLPEKDSLSVTIDEGCLGVYLCFDEHKVTE